MAVKESRITEEDQFRQRKSFYRALSENVQSVLFFWHGVALFCFALALGYWARGDLETQKELKETKEIIALSNLYKAEIDTEVKHLKKRIEELEK